MKRFVPLLALLVSFSAYAERVRPIRTGVADAPADWLRQRAIPIATTEPTGDASDLRPLLGLIGNARIVALGDVTHGTHEVFAFKQRVVPLLAANGFDTIAFEAPFGEWETIDEGGDITAPLAQNDYFFWDADEIASLIDWARAHRVKLAGVDVAHPFPVIDRLLDRLRRIGATLADDAVSRYECFLAYRAMPGAYRNRATCREDVAAVRTLIASHRAAFASDEELETALHEARVVEQGELALSTAHLNRDEAMAENVEWLIARGHRVILIGHNEHMGRTPYALAGTAQTVSTGTLLAQRFGADYFVLGSVIGSGTFNAYEYSGTMAFLRVHAAPPAGANDVATLLRLANLPRMLVPLRNTAPAWLASPHVIRTAGTNVPSAQKPMLELTESLAEKFDALLFIESTTPTHLRHWPTLP